MLFRSHPVTIADAHGWMKQQNSPYLIKEAALLFESGAAKDLDYIIGVTAPESLRISRVVKRDGIDASQVKKKNRTASRRIIEAEIV